MLKEPLVPSLHVLGDDDFWPEFEAGLRSLGELWTAPSGRSYRLDLEGRRLRVDLLLPDDVIVAPTSASEVDRDLFELACALQDVVGGEWSAEGLRRSAELFGWCTDC